MAATPSIKFMTTGSGGAVHVVTTKREDLKHSKCPTVKKRHEEGLWNGKGLSPDAALALKPCARCDSHAIAEAERKARMTPDQKRAEAKQKADDTRDRFKKAMDKRPKGKDHAKSVRKSGGGMTRRGPKGGDVTEKMKANVEEHAKLAEQNGWKAKAWESGINEWTCEATRNGETLKLIYRDGRTVWSRVILSSGVEVRLRNSSNWRKHATGQSKVKSDYQPRARGGKKAAKSEVIDDAAPRRLPFDIENDDHDTIIESLVGKRITWRNSVSKALDSAVLPSRSRNCRIRQHPKSERLLLSFYESQGMSDRGEMLGGERTVYLDKILKVRSS